MNSRFIKFMTPILSLAFFLPCAQALSADYTIENSPAWSGANGILGWGTSTNQSTTPSYGQTFTAPVVSGGTVLSKFSLYFKYFDGAQQNFKFHVYNWSGTAPTGAPLFSSSELTAPSSSSFTKVTFNTNNTPLASGGQYLATISTVGVTNSPGLYYVGFTDQSSYSGGNFTYNNNDNSLTADPWLNWGFNNNADLAFVAEANLVGPLSN